MIFRTGSEFVYIFANSVILLMLKWYFSLRKLKTVKLGLRLTVSKVKRSLEIFNEIN